jgi:hypothetical protein
VRFVMQPGCILSVYLLKKARKTELIRTHPNAGR